MYRRIDLYSGEGLALDVEFQEDVSTWSVSASLLLSAGVWPTAPTVETTSNPAIRRVILPGSTAVAIAGNGATLKVTAVDPASPLLPVVEEVGLYVKPDLSSGVLQLSVVDRTVNVLDLGADPTGVADSTVAIQAALTAGAGRTIYFPAGTYLVTPVAETTWLKISSNTTLCGDGPQSVIKVASGAGLYRSIFGASPNITSNVSNITIRDLRIDSNAAGQGGVQVDPADNAKLCTPFLFWGTAFSNIVVDRVVFDYCGYAAFVANEGAGTTANRVAVRDCSFTFTRLGAVNYDNSAIYTKALDVEVSGNRFYSATVGHARGCIEIHASRAAVTGNISDGYETLAYVVADGADANGVAVTGNTASRANNAISLWAISTYTLRDVTITGNTVNLSNADYAKSYSIGIGTSYTGGTNQGHFDGIVIDGNVVTMQAETGRAGYDATTVAGIFLKDYGNISNVVVTGNIVKSSPSIGLILHSVSGSARRIRIAQNVFVNCGNDSALATYYRFGLMAAAVLTDVQVEGNSFVQSSAVGYNWASVAGGATVTRVAVVRNTWDPALTQSFVAGVINDAVSRRVAFGTSAPGSDTWVRGDLVWNQDATVGQPKGWQCTVGGTPGTWVSMGNL